MVLNLNLNVNVKNDLYFTFSCELVGWLTITKSQALEKIYRTYVGAIEGVVGEKECVSWGGAQTKGEVHTWKLTNKMFFHIGFLTLLISSLIPLFFTIGKLALRTNEIKR